MDINNGIIFIWGRQSHPKMSSNKLYDITITFPVSFTEITYNIVTSFIVDAGHTFYLRQTGVDLYTVSSINIYFWSTNHALDGEGKISYHIIGY